MKSKDELNVGQKFKIKGDCRIIDLDPYSVDFVLEEFEGNISILKVTKKSLEQHIKDWKLKKEKR